MNPERTRSEFLPTKDILQCLGIKLVLFDVDSTLVRTAKTFNEQFAAYVSSVHHLIPDRTYEELLQLFFQANKITQRAHSVTPRMWVHTAHEFARLCGLQNTTQLINSTGALFQIYNEIPEPRKGVVNTLIELHSTQVKLGVVTHAEEAWTYHKLGMTFLKGFFDSIHVVDVKKPEKTADDWIQAIDHHNVLPSEVLVVGDNIVSDILAADAAKVRYLALIINQDSVYPPDLSAVPERAIVIEEMQDLIPQLSSLAA